MVSLFIKKTKTNTLKSFKEKTFTNNKQQNQNTNNNNNNNNNTIITSNKNTNNNNKLEDILDDNISIVSDEYDFMNFLTNTEPIKTRNNNPVSLLTSKLLSTYKSTNPNYLFFEEMKPRRDLTDPNEGVNNEGRDNINNDLIVFVGDSIVNKTVEYVVVDILGKLY